MRSIMLSVLALMLAATPALAEQIGVRIDKNTFEPARIVIKPGDSVVWMNLEKRTSHDVIFEDGERSPRLLPEEVYKRTFDKPGTYPYHCEPHPQMKGEVVVEP